MCLRCNLCGYTAKGLSVWLPSTQHLKDFKCWECEEGVLVQLPDTCHPGVSEWGYHVWIVEDLDAAL